MQVKLNKIKCQRCNYQWIPRKEDIRQCPKCKSAYWETPKEIKNVD